MHLRLLSRALFRASIPNISTQRIVILHQRIFSKVGVENRSISRTPSERLAGPNFWWSQVGYTDHHKLEQIFVGNDFNRCPMFDSRAISYSVGRLLCSAVRLKE